MRIRQIAIPTGIAVVLMTAVSSPGYAASAPVKQHVSHTKVTHTAADSTADDSADPTDSPGPDDSTGSDDSAGPTDGDTASTSAFGTLTSFDPSTGVLVVATSAGGTVSVSVTAKTRLHLAADKPAGKPVGKHPGKHLGEGRGGAKGVDGGPGEHGGPGERGGLGSRPTTTPAQRRAAALAALVAGASIQRLGLDPRTGDLREVVVVGPVVGPAVG
jgi:hypothetical protein